MYARCVEEHVATLIRDNASGELTLDKRVNDSTVMVRALSEHLQHAFQRGFALVASCVFFQRGCCAWQGCKSVRADPSTQITAMWVRAQGAWASCSDALRWRWCAVRV